MTFEFGLSPEWSQPQAFSKDSTGRIFVATKSGNVYYTTHPQEKWFRIGAVDNRVWDMAAKNDGIVYVATEGGLYRVTLEHSADRIGFRDTTVHHLEIDSDGVLWMATETGLYKLDHASSDRSEVSTPATPVHTVKAHGNSTLAAASDATVFASSDKGMTWNQKSIPVDDIQNFYKSTDMLFTNDTTLLVSIGGHLGTDQGIWRWELGDSENTSQSISEIWVNELVQGTGGNVFAAVHGRCDGASCNGGGVYKSYDAGQTWQHQTILNTPILDLAWGPDNSLLAANVNSNTTVAGSRSGWGVVRIDTTSDTWESVNRGLDEFDVNEFATISPEVWISAIPGIGAVRTENEGESWSLIGLPPRDTVLASGPTHEGFISSIDHFKGVTFVSRFGGILHRSFDGGVSWDTGRIEVLQSDSLWRGRTGFLDIEKVSEEIFVAALPCGYFRTTDAGATWTKMSDIQPVASSRSDPIAVDLPGNRIYAIQDTQSSTLEADVVISRDSGRTWKSTGLQQNVSNLKVGLNGDLAAFSRTDIYMSEAGSETWNKLSTEWDMSELNDVLIGPNDTLYAATLDGLWFSGNGGNNWNQELELAGRSVSKLKLGPDDRLYALSGGVLQSEQQIVVNNKSSSSGPHPMRFELNRNYPNPFNPTTNIRFSLPQSEQVTLKIYDLLGREVQTLINRRMQPGTHTVEFKGTDLSSGVYIYRLETEGYSQSKKMLLVK